MADIFKTVMNPGTAGCSTVFLSTSYQVTKTPSLAVLVLIVIVTSCS